ncbi:hypothetical protein HDV05_002838 [Chytridiales sp. JEL 0842]|nr:hypothetical protein HDV05_002838 [Chytridiales sp. JEL 0842]
MGMLIVPTGKTNRGILYGEARKLDGFKLIVFNTQYHAFHATKACSEIYGVVSAEVARQSYVVPYPQPEDCYIEQSKTLHVTHLPPNYTQEEMIRVFQLFEGFDSAQFFPKYSYVKFTESELALKARTYLRTETNLVVTFAKVKKVPPPPSRTQSVDVSRLCYVPHMQAQVEQDNPLASSWPTIKIDVPEIPMPTFSKTFFSKAPGLGGWSDFSMLDNQQPQFLEEYATTDDYDNDTVENEESLNCFPLTSLFCNEDELSKLLATFGTVPAREVTCRLQISGYDAAIYSLLTFTIGKCNNDGDINKCTCVLTEALVRQHAKSVCMAQQWELFSENA